MVLTSTSQCPPVSIINVGKSSSKDPKCLKATNDCAHVVGYKVQELPGRGSGLIATKDFSPGDLIMRENPIIAMPDKVFR